MKRFSFILLIFLFLTSCKEEPPVQEADLQLISVSVGTEKLSLDDVNEDYPFDQPVLIRFSQGLNTSTVENNVAIEDKDGSMLETDIEFLDQDKTISVQPASDLDQASNYTIVVGSGLEGVNAEIFPGFSLSFTTLSLPLELEQVIVDGKDADEYSRLTDISFFPTIRLHFSEAVSTEQLKDYTSITLGSLTYNYTMAQEADSLVVVSVTDKLPDYRMFRLTISGFLSDVIGKDFETRYTDFYTRLDSADKFPRISDEELLDLVQEQTFTYFWDFAHPTSGMIRERNTSNDNVTSGGSGFGLMAIPVGIERGYISRTEGVARLATIVDFLGTADRFHGAWSHWLSGSTGKVNPFSTKDNGGDLVETSYMAMGLMTVREYLDKTDTEEALLIDDINALLDAIEWDWYTQGENSLTWHWSPNYGFEMNMKVRGWNEALITYVMAATSSAHSITKEVYEQGWGAGSNMINGKDFYGIKLPLGRDYGGPLFFEQYTFLGLDPRNLDDQYASYWEQVVNHTLINRQYCIENPISWVGYSPDCWGLTASDGDQGYSAHAPNNDRGVITPTAAISSIPFTPEESMEAMRFFYYKLGDKLWGPYGFYDAFNVTNNWYGTSNLAIDQGPMILMIENYRSALLWDLFMSAPEVQSALTTLGFTY